MPLTKLRKTPGVYVEEISIFPPSVAPVETAIPAFLGHTSGGKGLIGKPTRITSMLEFDENFVDTNDDGSRKYEQEKNIEVTLNGSVDKFTIDVSLKEGKASSNIFRYAMQIFFANGGSDCYVVSMGVVGSDEGKINYAAALAAIKLEDEPTILVCSEAVLGSYADQKAFIDGALQQCSDLQDRVAVFDVPMEVPTGTPADGGADDNNISAFRNIPAVEIELAKYGAAYYPFLETTLNYIYDEASVSITDNRAGLPPSDAPDDDDGSDGGGGPMLDSLATGNNDLYNAIKAKLNELYVVLPPSSAMAGIYARVDNSRGVWKAPANVSVAYTVRPTIKIDDKGQESLNVDVIAGKSINAIRSFTGRGTLVWGARTLAGNDNEWRYVPVRRFFNFVEESVKKATVRFVFEPNNKNTWVKVKAMIENFLIVQWRAGALVGAKPEQAFFVKIGLNDTMTAEDVLNGYMVVEIGMAVVRPAEFIILQFMHKMQES